MTPANRLPRQRLSIAIAALLVLGLTTSPALADAVCDTTEPGEDGHGSTTGLGSADAVACFTVGAGVQW